MQINICKINAIYANKKGIMGRSYSFVVHLSTCPRSITTDRLEPNLKEWFHMALTQHSFNLMLK